MVNAIPKPIKDIWDAWSIRTTLIFSLSLQMFLIFFAPQRKRTSRKVLLSLIWSAYLLADWAANFAAGQISDSQGDDAEPGEPKNNSKLLAFWVPFLLLHLGGPDTITALALEDNELWLRHLLGLGFQAIATVYVFLQSLPNDLWRPIVLVSATGVIKYVERTLALYLASLDKFKDSMIQRPDPGPNYAKLMEEYAAKKVMKMPTQIIKIEEPEKDPKAGAKVKPDDLTELNILQYAYKYFNIFKGLVVDLIFTFQQRAESKRFFSELKPDEALRILEVELNFIYEALYTKAEILHNWIGVIFRFIALGCLIAALRIFQYKDKKDYGDFDVGLTYALLIGGIALDCIALIMFCLSDWTFVRLRKMKDEVDDPDTKFDKFLNRILVARGLKTEKYRCFKPKDAVSHEVNNKLNWFNKIIKPILISMRLKKDEDVEKDRTDKTCHEVLDTFFMVRRWSEYVHAHNLLEYCLWITPKRIHHTKGFIHMSFDWFFAVFRIGVVFEAIGKAIAFCFHSIKQAGHNVYKWFDNKISVLCKNRKWLKEDYIRSWIYWTFVIVHLLGYLIRKFMDFFGIQAQFEEIIFTSSDRVTLDLWEHIFGEVLKKSRFADDSESAMRVSSARGDWSLRDIQGEDRETEKKREKLLRYVMEMDYDQSLLVWHIATELLYQSEPATEETTTMVDVIPEHIKDVWDRWNIRGAIILSLTLQAILICFSPLRKRTPRRLLIMLVWSSYLLADWSANFAVGLISKNQDTITAFALEDNALWLRHVFGLVFQAIAGVYVVLQSIPNSLWLIILLVFISGTIKYLERTTALYSASLDKLPTKIILIDEPDKENRPKKLVHPAQASEKRKEKSKLTDLEIAQYAYKFFNTFKGLVVNLIFSFRERDESLEIFENLTDPEEALRIIEVELGFLYDALFTKVAVLHTVIGTISRVVASGTLVAAFILFHKKPNKGSEFHPADVVVTYTLFAVGLALDLISILLFLFSDWTCAALSSLKDDPDEDLSPKDQFFNWLLSLRKLSWTMQECNKEGDDKCSKHEVLTTGFFLRRWCGSINVFNFLAYATNAEVARIHDARGKLRRYAWTAFTYPFEKLSFIIQTLGGWVPKLINAVHKRISHKVNETSRKHPWARSTIYPFYFGFLSRIPHFIKFVWDKFSDFFDISDMLDMVYKTLFVHGEPMTKELWAFMFNELKYKSKFGDSPENAKRISLARGQWTLRDNLPEDADREKLVGYVTNFDYDQSLLMWHIATELCYQQEETIPEGYDKSKHYSNREFSKIISDYVMYLLIMQPGLMSEVAGIGKIRFRDTMAEADKFFHRRHIENVRDVKIASKTILDVSSDIDPMGVKGDRSKSVLFDASRLAKDLRQLEERYGKDKWEILSKVWVELLCYAACHCDSTAHVEQLSRGGELINFVWLLMAHFGLTDQFQINKGDARAKLIIGK
ncbi:unnamed protein product [Brassica napus]|uniref:(rape) hypothetical protein n=1 Tax=Brassica napus TaxID=3708 RepID=A0A816X3G8_BRANA|nr:unnamed protein product [Brassica napus]